MASPPDPLRYDGHLLDPDEVSGIVVSMVPRGSRVLDVGCGTGSLDRILAERCEAKVVGVEPDRARAEVALGRGIHVEVAYLTEDLIARLGRFDVVLLADVLEHLPDPQTMLLLCRDALESRGAVIISVPNVAHWSVRSYLVRGRFEYRSWGIMDATHLRWFTAESLKSFLARSGFNVVGYRGTAGIWLVDNIYRAPIGWLPEGCRTRFLRTACRRWPTLFGAQHVVKAEVV